MEINKPDRAFRFGILCCALLCLYILFFLPTFDLDESLYRRVAAEMKLHGDYWHPTWDARPLLHKPPILYWIIDFFSSVIDRTPDYVSSVAARMPGFLISVAMTFALGWRASMYLWMGAFPLLTVCSVIYDPLQTLALLPALLIPVRWFHEDRAGTTREYAYVALSMFAACAVKGLNGLVLPALAVGVQLLVRGGPEMWRRGFAFKVKSFWPAVALSALYYWWLDQKMGRAFTEEFFLVQHFGRSQAAQESHGGGILYYPLVVFIGAGMMLPFLISAIKSLGNLPPEGPTLRQTFARVGFPLTYALCFIVLFSFSATKLPHYLWPIWPALAIFIAGRERSPMGRIVLMISLIPMFIFTATSILLALNPISLLHDVIGSPAFKAIFPIDYSMPLSSRAMFALAAIIGASIVVRRRKLAETPSKAFGQSALFCLLLVGAFGPIFIERVHNPAMEIAKDVNSLDYPPNTCMWYTGPHSATLSIALGNNILHNRCEPPDMAMMIAPDWKVQECEERGMKVVSHHGYLNLCVSTTKSGTWGAKAFEPGFGGVGGAPMANANPTGTAILPGADGILGTADDIVVQNHVQVGGEDATDPQSAAMQELVVTQLAGMDKTPNTLDDVVTYTYAGPDGKLGTEDDVPAPRLGRRKSKSTKSAQSAVTHLGFDKAGNTETMEFVGGDGVEGTADDVVVTRAAGPDGKTGTADDVVVTQMVGEDGIAGTKDDIELVRTVGDDKIPGNADDVVSYVYAGPDKIFGTEDDVPTTPLAKKDHKAYSDKESKKVKSTQLDLGDDREVVMTFAGEDEKFGTSDDVVVIKDKKTGKTTTQAIGEDKTPGTEDDVSVTRLVGDDGIPGTEDDVVAYKYAGPDKAFDTGDDVPATPLGIAATSIPAPGRDPILGNLKNNSRGIPRTRSSKKGKVVHIGLKDGREVVMTFTSEDEHGNAKPAPDDVAVIKDKRGKVTRQMIGDDLTPGTADDVVVTEFIGKDKLAGSKDHVLVAKRVGPDLLPDTADDEVIDLAKGGIQFKGGKPLVEGEQSTAGAVTDTKGAVKMKVTDAKGAATGTGAYAKKADEKPPIAKMFPVPPKKPTPRKAIVKVAKPAAPKTPKENPAKVKKIAFEKNVKVVEQQVLAMDFCEAYLCDDQYKSERVLENIESFNYDYQEPQYRAVQLKMLNDSLIKAIEYKKNWRKYTPEYEVGLMSQEQVDGIMTPLIQRLRDNIKLLKK
ncbi:MAG: hypothetical protein JST80_06570 [Bdellovibrionales bacterium]|nr:hypothetical protein [Bdellovibrionales bacterium]